MPEKSKLLVGLLIFSEANFFLVLIIAYIFYHATGGVWLATTTGPTAAGSLSVGLAAINTLFLLASSVTMHRAEQIQRSDDPSQLPRWLLVTIALGTIFLILQGVEWSGLIRDDVTISRDLFGSTFFTLTGFHGFHVFVGLVCLLILVGMALARGLTRKQGVALEAVALYWHFVDAVWIVVFTVVYLWVLL